jgi:hypothetical protein
MRLGHRTICVTLDHQSRAFAGSQQGAAVKVDVSIRAAIERGAKKSGVA